MPLVSSKNKAIVFFIYEHKCTYEQFRYEGVKLNL